MAVPVKLFLNKSLSQKNKGAIAKALADIDLELDVNEEGSDNIMKSATVQKVLFPKNIKMRLELQEGEKSPTPSIVFQEGPDELMPELDLDNEKMTPAALQKGKTSSTSQNRSHGNKRKQTMGVGGPCSKNSNGIALNNSDKLATLSEEEHLLPPRNLSNRKAFPVSVWKWRKKIDGSDSLIVNSSQGKNATRVTRSSNNISDNDSSCIIVDVATKNGSLATKNTKSKRTRKEKEAVVKNTNSSCDVSVESENTKKGDSKEPKCGLCGKVFLREDQVNIHMRIHTGMKPFECSWCHKGFTQSRELRKHVRLHTGEKLSTCTVCEKVFITKSGLARHMRSHTGEKPYTCLVCGKSYRENSVLQGHMRLHTGEKPFMCSLCGKSFHQGAHLYAHMKSHTGEKPHNCTICGKSYRQRAEVKVHMRVHTGERPHKCPECDKAFRDGGTLKKHMKIHTGEKPWKCSMCGESFRESGAMYKHMRGHTGEKPHKCTECGKAFREKDVLNRHMRIHTGEKPCRCTVCHKAFRESGALYRHMRTHAKKGSKSDVKESASQPVKSSPPSTHPALLLCDPMVSPPLPTDRTTSTLPTAPLISNVYDDSTADILL